MATAVSKFKSGKKSQKSPAPEESESKAKPEESEQTQEAESVKDSEVEDTKQQAPEHTKPQRQWHMTGEEATGAAEREYETNRRKPFRFWLKGGDSGEIIFLDEAGFAFWEHEIKIAGKWTVVTCLRGVDPKGCPMCKHFGNGHRYIVSLRSIIDNRPFEMKNGEARDWSRKLLATKDRTNKIIERRRKTRGTLVGSKYIVTRTDGKTARCGDDFEFIEEVDLSQFQYEDQQSKEMKQCEAYDYAVIFAPMDYATVKEMIVEAEVDDDEAGSSPDQDVPF